MEELACKVGGGKDNLGMGIMGIMGRMRPIGLSPA